MTVISAAFFDFDDTLIHGDSLLTFLEEAAGPWTARRAFALAAATALRDRALTGGGDHLEFKTAVKAKALQWTLAGASLADCAAAAGRVAGRLRWCDAMLKVVADLRGQGARIVLATGALDVYLSAVLAPLGPLDGLLCTEMATVDGRLTGAMASANCVRREKARRVRAWLAAHPMEGLTVAYGNRPSDLPMLAAVGQGWEVRLRRGGAPKLTAAAHES